jgi:hypothetical protein
VAHLTVSRDSGTKVVTVDAPVEPGIVPVKKDIVRIDHSSGKWLITPYSPGQVKVEYTIHVDPGGSLPAWLVNTFATEGPLHIFRNLKIQLQKPVYKNSILAFVQN